MHCNQKITSLQHDVLKKQRVIKNSKYIYQQVQKVIRNMFNDLSKTNMKTAVIYSRTSSSGYQTHRQDTWKIQSELTPRANVSLTPENFLILTP